MTLHPDTSHMVTKMSAELRAKLLKKQPKYGNHKAAEAATVEELQHALWNHVHKGDPLDVIAFAMFLLDRGARTI